MAPIHRRLTLSPTLMPISVHRTSLKDKLMKPIFKPLLLAGVLATAGLAAFAASGDDCADTMGYGGGKHHEGMGKMDATKIQARMDQRFDALKMQLKITPAQESAWSAYTAAMKPPAGMMAHRPDPAEMQKLSTPERIDKMQALRTQRMTQMNATMTQRGEATKAIYAVLTPEQRKLFDDGAMQRGERHGGKHGMGYGQPKS